jgi:hypothetical protein
VVSTGASRDENAVRRGLRNALSFFKERVDMALEDKDEAAISRIVAPRANLASLGEGETEMRAVWQVDLSLFVREPVGPLDAKAAAKLDRTSLRIECVFGDRDEGVYPSRGGAEARRSRFFGFSTSGESQTRGAPPGYWIADEPGFFKFSLPATSPISFSNITCVPIGAVYFNAEIETERKDAPSSETRLVSGVATIKRDVPASFMGADYSGILAEYVVVGTFSARRVN